ncbi:MAG: efflux RND transporter permease subunit [Haliea sp.]
MINTISHGVTKHPILILLFTLTVTVLAAFYAISGLSVQVVLEEMLPVHRSNIQLYSKFSEQFGGTNTTLITVENTTGDIYNAEFLEKYRRISNEIYFHPSAIRHLVQSLSLRKTKAVSGSGGMVEINSLMWPELPESAREMDEFRTAVRTQFRGFLVADDEKSAVIIADFKDDTDYEELVNFLENLRLAEGDSTTEIYIAGRPVLLGIIYQALGDIVLVLGLSVLLIAAILYLYFHSLIGVLVPLATASTVMLWGAGVIGFIGYNLDPLLILLPAFIFAIVLSHSIQLTSRVLEGWRDSGDWQVSVKHGLRCLLIPSTAAIITDAAGFTVLTLVGIPSIQGLAIICTLWLLSIAPALVLATAVLTLCPPPNRFRIGIPGIGSIWNFLKIDRLKYFYVAGTVSIFAFGFMGAQDLTIGDAKGSEILWPDSRFNQDVEAINTRFSRLGTDVMQVYIEGPEGTMLSPEVYRRVEALDRHVYQSVEAARPAQSLVPVIKKINEVLYEGDPSYAIIPETPEEIGMNIYMFRSRGEPGDFAAYTDSEWQTGTVSFFLEDHSGPTVKEASGAVHDFAQSIDREGYFQYTGGQIGITEAMNDEIADSNLTVLLSIIAVISVCVLLYYRSIVTAVVLVFGLVTSNFLTYAFMASQGIGLSANTLPLAALGIGLGVDYAIYMVDRIREEYHFGGSEAEAVARAFRTSGSAIVMTALAMVIPLLPWWFLSVLRFQAEMGVLLAMVLMLNMASALVFLPSAFLILKPKSLFRREEVDTGLAHIADEIADAGLFETNDHRSSTAAA